MVGKVNYDVGRPDMKDCPVYVGMTISSHCAHYVQLKRTSSHTGVTNLYEHGIGTRPDPPARAGYTKLVGRNGIYILILGAHYKKLSDCRDMNR